MDISTISRKFLIPVAISLASISAHAELSLGLQGGLTSFTTRLNGDAIYDYGNPGSLGYYDYSGDYNRIRAVGGVLARYLFPVYTGTSIGMETGYTFWGIDYTRERANDNYTESGLPAPNTDVDDFTTKSQGVILLNAVLSLEVVPSVTVNLFGGPAWLNTQYKDHDIPDNYARNLSSIYQSTADAGIEAEWKFYPEMSASMRFDYLFETSSRTISTTGVNGQRLVNPESAKTGATVFSFTVRYLIPYA